MGAEQLQNQNNSINLSPPKLGFTGSFAQIVDSKNRISVPQRFRDVLNRTYGDEELRVMITVTLDKNIAVFPIRTFYEYINTVNEDVPEDERHKKRHRRMFFEGFSETDILDNQNRIRINPRLLKFSSIDRDIYVIGFTDHFEVWERNKWDQFVENQIRDLPNTFE